MKYQRPLGQSFRNNLSFKYASRNENLLQILICLNASQNKLDSVKLMQGRNLFAGKDACDSNMINALRVRLITFYNKTGVNYSKKMKEQNPQRAMNQEFKSNNNNLSYFICCLR